MARTHADTSEGPEVEMSNKNSEQFTSDKKVERAEKTFDSETPTYPSGVKLTFIFVALCLTVFLVALVRASYFHPYTTPRPYKTANTNA